MWFDTKSTFLTAGSAQGGTALNAFDNALQDAKICDFNLIKVSSILPPGKGLRRLHRSSAVVDGRGMMLPAVVASFESVEVGETVSAGVAVGIPTDPDRAGVVYLHSGLHTKGHLLSTLEQMVDEALRVRRGVASYDFEPAIVQAVVKPPYTGVVACLGYCDPALERLFFGFEHTDERDSRPVLSKV